MVEPIPKIARLMLLEGIASHGTGCRCDEALVGLVHHSDRGVQYLSIRYTERLAEAEAVSSVGSRGDS